jgi:16S rRNA (guanine966-N2)-methyltransferase
VTRIISGRAGGTALEVPATGTRPTSDRVRESLFGALESAGALEDARVLDLYAGSGALGLEAVSRGAASVDLVERSPAAATIAERNIARVAKALGARPSMRVHRSAVAAFLRPGRGPFDLVFLDPPYDIGEEELAGALEALAAVLSPDAVVVVERSRRSPAPDWARAGLEALRERTYGDTTMWWGQPRAESQSR